MCSSVLTAWFIAYGRVWVQTLRLSAWLANFEDTNAKARTARVTVAAQCPSGQPGQVQSPEWCNIWLCGKRRGEGSLAVIIDKSHKSTYCTSVSLQTRSPKLVLSRTHIKLLWLRPRKMPPRDDRGGSGCACGGCLIFVGTFSMIVTSLYVIQPGKHNLYLYMCIIFLFFFSWLFDYLLAWMPHLHTPVAGKPARRIANSLPTILLCIPGHIKK